MSKKISFALIIILYSSELIAGDIFDKLAAKEWHGKGVLMSVDATFEMSWKTVLNSQFMHLHFHNKRLLKNGQAYSLSAHAYYKKTENNTIEGTWFDSRGMTLTLSGFYTTKSLTINWGTEKTEQGRTIYSALDNNKIQVIDFVLKDGKYLQFAEAIYQ